jgi:hypothetical protein
MNSNKPAVTLDFKNFLTATTEYNEDGQQKIGIWWTIFGFKESDLSQLW